MTHPDDASHLTADSHGERAHAERVQLASRMVGVLPRFGNWASAIRDFETPFGKVGLRQLTILWAIRHEFFPPDEMSATTLASFYQVQPSVVTKALARLEAGGFIVRASDPADSRRALITITERGTELSRFVEHLFVTDMMDSLDRTGNVGEPGAPSLADLARAIDVLDAVSDDLLLKVARTRKPTRQRRGPGRSRASALPAGADPDGTEADRDDGS